jgi:molybdate transport system substrate-binding protein
VIFAAASLKNALDEADRSLGQGNRQAGSKDFLCGQQRARQAARAGRPGRSLPLRRSRLDGLCGEQEPDQAGDAVSLLANRIALIAPVGFDGAKVTLASGVDLSAALGSGKLAMGNVDSVPAGKYGKAALEKLGGWDKVKDNVAQADNVRAALLLVRAARRRSASSTPPTPPPSPRSRSSRPSRRIRTRRSSIPSR